MTSAQLMPSGAGPRTAVAVAGLAMLMAAAGCLGQRLRDPAGLTSPYHDAQLWAVAPFGNESGVSTVDPYRVADMFVQQLQQVEGIDTIPVNRVLAAMQATGTRSITTSAEATQLAGVLDVDAIIVGTITAWDPYPPPTMGMAIQLFANRFETGAAIDPHVLVRSPSGDVAPGDLGPPRAAAQAAGVFDSRNHQTLAWLNEFAAGRTAPDEPFGSDIYLMNMELYTQFVSYRLIHDLLAFERSRLTPVANTTER